MTPFAICVAQPASAATQMVTVNATSVKPLSLVSVQSLDLGTLVLGPGSWQSATVGISRAGVFTCANAFVTCSGTTQAASYTVTGSNGQVVRIMAPDVTLTNQATPSQTLLLVVDNPGTVTLPNSGTKGVTFSLGGSIVVSPNTVSGTYAGTFNVTVDY